MKNKRDIIFIIVISAVCIAVMLFAPALKLAEEAGLVSLPKMGNIIESERVYEDGPLSGLLNGIEGAKAGLTDIYINYLPFYAETATFSQTKQVDLNRGFNEFLSSLIKPTVPVTLDNDTAAIDTQADTEVADTEADDIEAAVTEAPAEPLGLKIIGTDWGDIDVASYKTRFLKSSKEGINLYAVDATLTDGSEIGLITTAFNTQPGVYSGRMRTQAALINGIAAANTDVNAYVYICSRLQDCEEFADICTGEPSTYPLVNEFIDLLDDRIRVDRLKIDSLEDGINKLFLTDHHWNAYGMYEAYCDIVNMMRADSPSIDEPRQLGIRYDIDGADFYGTFARTCGYFNYKDAFFFYDYGLPTHTIKTSQRFDYKKNLEKYLNGDFAKDIGADHYVNFYPYSEYLEYPENDTGRVLLLFGDSYSRGISEPLSSAFDEAYIYDYRRIKEIGNYNAFIEKHGVTDILFMQYSLRGVFNNQNDNTLDTLILK